MKKLSKTNQIFQSYFVQKSLRENVYYFSSLGCKAMSAVHLHYIY